MNAPGLPQMRAAGHDAVVLHCEYPAAKFYFEDCGAGRGSLRRIDFHERSRLSSSRRFALQDPARKLKKDEYNELISQRSRS